MTRAVRCLPLLLLPLALACQRSAPEVETAETAQPVHAIDTAAESGAPHEAQRLRAIMLRLGEDMDGLSHALWRDDYAQVARRAGAIADHPHVAPEEMQRIQGVLGAEMPKFAEADHAVHDAAVRLRDAAEARRTDAVLKSLAEVQTGCVSCHTQFRERLRTDRL